jgi:transcriptional antiterminator RfaH
MARFESLTQRLDLEGGERWFAARTLPHRENSAHFNLHCLGFRGFVPRFWRTIRHANKLRNVFAPLFPGYIFVILDLSRDRWRSVNYATGVASLIMGVEQPMPVPPGVVEALIARRESSGTIRLDRDLEVGERVRILSGPFAETLCRIEHLDDRGRVRVLLEIMGGQVVAQVDRSTLSPGADRVGDARRIAAIGNAARQAFGHAERAAIMPRAYDASVRLPSSRAEGRRAGAQDDWRAAPARRPATPSD